MKIFLCILLAVNMTSLAQQTRDVETRFETLKWLEGTWERTNIRPGNTANEKWTKAGPFEFVGVGITLKEKDTLFQEKIQIKIKQNEIYYIADVKENKEPVFFKFTSISANGFVCENAAHNFPKKIEYRLNDTQLMVIISANRKSQNYLFVKR